MNRKDVVTLSVSYFACVVAAYYTILLFDKKYQVNATWFWVPLLVGAVYEFVIVFWCAYCFHKSEEEKNRESVFQV